MNILVFQHHTLEHPGIFCEFMKKDGVCWTSVELQKGETIPSLDDFDALWVMGGPMDVWDEVEYPWLIKEKDVIREAVLKRKMPFLGMCLGHQLLAEATGGKCEKLNIAEVGISDITLTEAGQIDKLTHNFDPNHKAVNWHGVHVAELPADAVILASSEICQCQSMRFGNHAWGIQYHIEVTEETVPQWSNIAEYKMALEVAMGANNLSKFVEDTNMHLRDFNRHARILYDNFINLVKHEY